MPRGPHRKCGLPVNILALITSVCCAQKVLLIRMIGMITVTARNTAATPQHTAHRRRP